MNQSLISIIIPCYNGEKYLGETLHSVLEQKEVSLEVIVVDDGSTDGTAKIVQSIPDPRVRYQYQANAGVSTARNNGLDASRGIYIVFFDADDLMEEGFLKSRLSILNEHPDADFVCGPVIKFTQSGRSNEKLRGPDQEHLPDEILLYNREVTTCPSNFLYRKEFLIKNKLRFNISLSSTADRFFLLQCHEKGKLCTSDRVSPLLYRVTENSMSNKMSPGLVKDNEQFYREIIRYKLIPDQLLRSSLSKGYWILAGANKQVGNHLKALRYLSLSMLKDPVAFVKRFGRTNPS